MYEIRVLFESKELGDSVSYPLNDLSPHPGESYERKGYAIYKYQEDGSQQCTEIIEQHLATAVVQMHDLMWPIVEKMIRNNYNKNKPKENGTKVIRQAATTKLMDLNRDLKETEGITESFKTKELDEWMVQYQLINVELYKQAIDTLTKWIEENYYPI